MTQIEKLIRKFQDNPASLSWADVEKIILLHGYTLGKVSGSHNKYKKPDSPDIVVAVHRGDCLAVYKHKAKKILFPPEN